MTYDDLSPDERERLRYAFESGFAAGAYCPSLVPDDLVELMQAVAIDWFASRETTQAVWRARSEMPGPETIPDWLPETGTATPLRTETAPLRGAR